MQAGESPVNVQSAINAGLFVEFVYENWNKISATTDLNGRAVVTGSGAPVIPGKSYTVQKTIYANDLATDINPARAKGCTTIGIIAQNDADPLDVVIAIRGTEGVWEWLQDFKFLPRPFPRVQGSGLTEDGFTDMYLSFSLTPGPSGTFMDDVVALLAASAKITISGHSLGAALATLLALDMAVNTRFPVTLYTLASPRVGDLSFHNLFNHVVQDAFRVANRLDIVPKTPPPLFYFHVGDETELVPPPELKFELGCEHSILSYFHMLAKLIGQEAKYPIDAKCLNG
ncbi:lipase family protein [Acidobacteria bacterium AB60]|nr:lipase family protein [Acidobacteria bacterium AB60]